MAGFPTQAVRRVRCGLWLEARFLALSEAEQLTALFIATGPHTNGLGLFRLSLAGAAEDRRVGLDTFKRRFDAVRGAMGWHYDASARVVSIPEWLSKKRPTNPNVVKSWRAAFNEVPDCRVKSDAAAAIVDYLNTSRRSLSESLWRTIS